ncbi:hypothetical protein Cgig2_005250 [Carnegiea gigantea]|uniref:BHLH domain-containing protein n=1 Tax=Carnegiea gigantea TaxID=171969 RepID=A0A9Q1K4L2_9CARY|nr:hypothetical protein Cgig2_005250 [Carnegiea gigantea]
MALDWENLFNFSTQIYPFEHQHQLQQYQENDELVLSLETELLCFDSIPPTLLDFSDPLLNPPPVHLDHHPHHDHQNLDNHGLMAFNSSDNYLDFPPPLLLPPEENLPFAEDYCTQLFPCSKKQKLLLPCFDAFVPGFNSIIPDHGLNLSKENQLKVVENNPNCQFHNSNVNGDGSNDGSFSSYKPKAVSAQSRAARERRRKITEKTQELGKLVPGGSKMNTAEMLQAAFKYVKFLQAQLGILQSMKTLTEKSDKKVNLDSLPLLASSLVQEKLYTKEKCLVPLDFLPIFEEHCNFDINFPKPN